MSDAIVGRDEQLERVSACLDTIAAGPRVVVVQGEAGIGKTAIWQVALDEAGRRSLRVLRAVGSEAEAKLSFTALADLLEDVIDDLRDVLPVAQRRALESALLLESGDATEPAPRAVLAGLLSSLRALASRAPLVVAVDDVQWLDGSSAGALAFALRRLRTEPVLCILTHRLEEPGPLPLGLDRRRPELAVERVWLVPLSFAGTQRLLRTRLGLTLPRPLMRRLHEASRGNPLFALELGAAVRERRPATAGEAFPVPAHIQELLRDRLRRLPEVTGNELLLAAMLDRPTVTVLGPAAAKALAPAVEAQIVELDERQVTFTHPLLASGVVEAASPETRRAAHARLADLVSAPEQRARHRALAAVTPDAATAAELDRAALALAGRGAPDAAAELAEQACVLTPAGEPEAACRRALEAGWYHFVAGDSERAHALLERAAGDCPPGPTRVRALTRLARLNMHARDRRKALALYRDALAQADSDPALRAEIHEGLAWCLFLLREDVPGAVENARSAVAFAERTGDRVVLMDALAVQAQSEFVLGGGAPSAAIERALAMPSDPAEPRVLRSPDQHWGVILLTADQLDAARDLLSGVHARALEHGDETALPWVLMRLAHVELLAGRWDAAAGHARAGYEHAVDNGQQPLQAELRCTEALIEAHRGVVAAARAAAGEGLDLAARTGAGIGARLAPWALGALELSLGDPDAALRQLEPLWRASRAAGIVDPGENRYVPDLFEALLAAGRRQEARDLCAWLHDRGRSLDRASALALAARCMGLEAAADGRIEDAEAAFAEALAHHDRAGIPFDRARTLFAAGTAQRRAKRKAGARMLLQQAADAFEGLGAAQWSERAREGLGRISGRRSAGTGLTPTQERIADMVVDGMSNKEIATALFVAPKTVETQLWRIYGKLGVHSRTQLARRLRG